MRKKNPENKNVANPPPLPITPSPLDLDPIPENNSVAGAARTPQNSTRAVRPDSSASLLQDASDVAGSDVNELMYGASSQREEEHRKPRPPLCSQRMRMFTLFMILLVTITGVGIHFIVQAIDEEENVPSLNQIPTTAPTFPTFDDFIVNGDDAAPAPTYSPVQMQSIDDVLFALSAETSSVLDTGKTIDWNDPSSPHGNCRLWLTQSDEIDLGLDPLTGQPEDISRIQQRFILCLLYEQMNGNSWQFNSTSAASFKDKTAHECVWDGVTCNGFDYVAVLDLWNKNLVGSIPEEITFLEKLQVLRLPNNTLTGRIPEKLLDLPDLLWLDLSNNQLTGSVVSSTASQSSLLTLYLNYNSLQGTIPYFPQLTSLRLHGNRFSELNAEYTTSAPLKRLVAYNNDFTGTFPQTWNLPNLEHLDLGLNQWRGRIPASLWQNTPQLEFLLLNDANLQGNLPATTASPNLSYVWLQSNQLTGTIPETFGKNWFNLTSVQLQGNAGLSGSLVGQCAQWQGIGVNVIQADCNRVSCTCCTSCS